MDFHFDKSLQMSKKHDSSLYKWYLSEHDLESGKQVGPDLIPWGWSICFTATKASICNELDVDLPFSFSDDDKQDETDQRVISRTVVRCEIIPSGRDENLFISMMGTDRPLGNITLNIVSVANSANPECYVEGGISTTSEIDFRDETHPDWLTLHLGLPRDDFQNLIDSLRNRSANNISLRVGSVPGFYSEWSPSISTRFIKILSRWEEHALVRADGYKEFDPPRLGAAKEFSLSTIETCVMDFCQTADDENLLFDNDCEPEPILESKYTEPHVIDNQSHAEKTLKAVQFIKTLSLCAFLLLILILIK